jgi:hypothetical protein
VRQIRLIVLVSVICTLTILFGLVIAFVDADFVDNKFKLSQHVTEKLSGVLVKEVDSGYSGIFIFRPEDPYADNALLFHAEPDQQVSFDVPSGFTVADRPGTANAEEAATTDRPDTLLPSHPSQPSSD